MHNFSIEELKQQLKQKREETKVARNSGDSQQVFLLKREQRRLISKIYHLQHNDKVKAYYQKNRDAIAQKNATRKEHFKLYYIKNREKILQYNTNRYHTKVKKSLQKEQNVTKQD